MQNTRRAVLKGGAGLLTVGALAGCIGGGDDDSTPQEDTESPDGAHAYGAFFTLADWAQQVAGDQMEVVNPVPIGEMGHGWEPSGDFGAQLAESDAFVYLDTPEFRWAQDAAAALEEEDVDVVTIDALEGVDMLEWDGEHGHDHGDHSDHDDHDHEEDREHEHDDHGEDDHDHDHEGEDGHDDHDHEGEDGHDHGEDDHGEDDHDHEGEEGHDDHDHGDYDPHVWVDPVAAQTCVDTIAAGFAEADPDNEDAYYENAETYKEELQALHERFESELTDRAHDTLVLAGHNSFEYLAVRYGFDIHSPQGVSPQDTPSQNEIIETIELVNELGISHVAYDYFDSDNLAQTIVDDSDAEETVTMSPAEGTTEEWNDNEWGYIEQMEEINLPAVKAALGIEE
ncbi:metal ABC transporter substrate-binding protein [Haloferacaceae archaeon DSL9]